MFHFKTIQEKNRNYSPATLINGYAKKHYWKTFYNMDSLRVSIAGIIYRYDHWKIDDIGNGKEQVTIYLKRGN